LNMVGAYSPFVEETVILNGKLNPENTNWMKIQVRSFCLEIKKVITAVIVAIY
jgi:hypothetical protein